MLRVIVQSNPSLQQWQIDFATSLALRHMSQIHPWIYTYDSRDYNRVGVYTRRSNWPCFAFSIIKGSARFAAIDSNNMD